MTPFDPKSAVIIVAAWPDEQLKVRLVTWLAHHGFDLEHNLWDHCCRDVVVAYNRAVRDLALPSRFDWFVFCDKDLMPGPAADPFLAADADVVGVQYPIRNPESWGEPTRIHTGLWRCHRGVLEALSPPWFARRYSHDGCDVIQCECDFFREKALAAGFAIARAGWADHAVK